MISPGGSPTFRPASVLVADDDAGVRYVVQWALESQGLNVRCVATSADAISSLRVGLPDLLLLDLTMPVHGGSAVADDLHSRGVSVPILVITGDGHAPEKARAIGAYGYLHKPFEIDELLKAVNKGLAS